MKIKLLFKIIRAIIKKPSQLYQVLLKEQENGAYSYSYNVTKHKKSKLNSISILDLAKQKTITTDIKYYSYLSGTSLISDFVLLRTLCQSIPDCDYLEIGTWRGESIANVADLTKSATGITLDDQSLLEMGVSQEIIDLHGFYVNDSKIRIEKANSKTFDFSSLDKTFDVMFIDGDHSYEMILNDSKKLFPLLKNEKSVIVWHDYGWDTERVRHNTLAAIFDAIPKEEHKFLYHVYGTKCAIFYRGPITSFDSNRYDLPKENFFHKVTQTRL